MSVFNKFSWQGGRGGEKRPGEERKNKLQRLKGFLYARGSVSASTSALRGEGAWGKRWEILKTK